MVDEIGRSLTGPNGPKEEGEGAPSQGTESQTALQQAPRGRAFSLAQMLVDAGILPADQVATAQEMAWRERKPLGHILVRDGLVLSRDLATLTALNLGLAMVDLRSQTIDRAAVGLIGAGIFQVINVRRFWADDARATFNLRHAGSWFAGDALNAEDALDAPGGSRLAQDCADPPASPVGSVTLVWTDAQGVSREATYIASGGGVTRENEADAKTAIVTSRVVAGTPENPVGFPLCGNLLRLDLNVEADKNETEAVRLSTYLRKLTP